MQLILISFFFVQTLAINSTNHSPVDNSSSSTYELGLVFLVVGSVLIFISIIIFLYTVYYYSTISIPLDHSKLPPQDGNYISELKMNASTRRHLGKSQHTLSVSSMNSEPMVNKFSNASELFLEKQNIRQQYTSSWVFSSNPRSSNSDTTYVQYLDDYVLCNSDGDSWTKPDASALSLLVPRFKRRFPEMPSFSSGRSPKVQELKRYRYPNHSSVESLYQAVKSPTMVDLKRSADRSSLYADSNSYAKSSPPMREFKRDSSKSACNSSAESLLATTITRSPGLQALKRESSKSGMHSSGDSLVKYQTPPGRSKTRTRSFAGDQKRFTLSTPNNNSEETLAPEKISSKEQSVDSTYDISGPLTPIPNLGTKTDPMRIPPSPEPSKKEDHGSNKSSAGRIFDPKDLEVFDDQKLGDGRYGIIYRGRYRGASVACKQVLNPNLYLKESDVFMNACLHKHVVRFYGITSCEDGDDILHSHKSHFIVMETFPHGCLLETLQREPPRKYSMIEKILLCKQMASGLLHIHQEKVIHGDIALRNILVDCDPNRLVCAISDFGMAKRYPNTEKTAILSPRWTAPELFQTHLMTFETDIWALGCCFTELFNNGNKPFDAFTSDELKLKMRQGAFMQPQVTGEDVPVSIMNLLDAMLQFLPENRPCARKVYKHLEVLYEGIMAGEVPIPTPTLWEKSL